MASYGLFASGCHTALVLGSPLQSGDGGNGLRRERGDLRGDSRGVEGQHSPPSAEMFVEDPVFPQHACVLLIFKEGSMVF